MNDVWGDISRAVKVYTLVHGVGDMVDVSRAIGISRVDGRQRIVLPRIIREELGLKTGDYVVFYLNDNGEICIAKARYPARIKAVLI